MVKNENLIKVRRGHNIESVHHVHIAVVNAEGKLLHQLGEVDK